MRWQVGPYLAFLRRQGAAVEVVRGVGQALPVAAHPTLAVGPAGPALAVTRGFSA